MMAILRDTKMRVRHALTGAVVTTYCYALAKIVERTVQRAEQRRNTQEFLNLAFEKYERKGGLLTKGEYLEALRIKPKQKVKEKIGEIYEVDSRTINRIFVQEIAIELGIRKRMVGEKPAFDEVHEMIAKIATIKGIPETDGQIREMHEEACIICDSLKN